eukprot:6163945-Pyramimonas_sp.AAC.1
MRHPPPSTALRGPVRGLHQRPQWDRPRASSTTQYSLCGSIEGSTEGTSTGARMRHPPPSAALRGPIRNATEGPSGTARMRHPPP